MFDPARHFVVLTYPPPVGCGTAPAGTIDLDAASLITLPRRAMSSFYRGRKLFGELVTGSTQCWNFL